MVLVDSSVWIAFFRQEQSAAVDRLGDLLRGGQPIVADLVLTEVLQGFLRPRDFDTALRLFDGIECVTVGGRGLAVLAARNYRILREHGFTIRRTIDTLLATWCIAHDRPLLSADRDFLPFERHLGLKSAMAIPTPVRFD